MQLWETKLTQLLNAWIENNSAYRLRWYSWLRILSRYSVDKYHNICVLRCPDTNGILILYDRYESASFRPLESLRQLLSKHES